MITSISHFINIIAKSALLTSKYRHFCINQKSKPDVISGQLITSGFIVQRTIETWYWEDTATQTSVARTRTYFLGLPDVTGLS